MFIDYLDALIVKAREIFGIHSTLKCRMWKSGTILLTNTHETLMETCTGIYEGKV